MKGLHSSLLLFIGFTVILLGSFINVSGQSTPIPHPIISDSTAKEYVPEWDFYFSNVDDKMSSLVVDLGLYKVAPIENKPNLAWISIKMNNAPGYGRTSSEESEILEKIEDKLVTNLHSKFNCIYVGRLTSNGHRDMFFYIGDTTYYQKVLSDFVKEYSEYHIEFGSKKDEFWSGYFDFLYPTPQQLQSIMNRRIIDQLEKDGDKLTKLRAVDHWIYFKTKLDLDLYMNRIKFDGFTVVAQNYDKKSGGLPYKLHIKRIDKVDWDSVDAYVIYLWKLAKEYHGVYDGWKTSVEKD